MMKANDSGLPPWVTRGKTIRQLIKELKTFEDQDLEVRISIDDGDTHFPISILGRVREKGKYLCLVQNSEAYFLSDKYKSFVKKQDQASAKANNSKVKKRV